MKDTTRNPPTRSDFEIALQRGLGRAVLWLQDGSVSPDRDLILHACTHNLAYDRQTEDNRALYLFDIIAATGEPDFYARRVEEALAERDEEHSQSQMLDLLGLRAKAGDASARRALYAFFEAEAAASGACLAEVLVDVDGLAGYLFIVRQWIAHPLTEDDQWYETFLRGRVEERFGAEAIQAFLSDAARSEPAVGLYWAAREEERAAEKARRAQRPARPQPGYAELRRLIADPNKRLGRMVWARFGERLDNADASRLAQDLLAETDAARLERYLSLFGRRPFPLDHRPLLALARVTEEKVAAAALFALAQVTHPSVQTLARDRIETARPWEALALLVRNYWDGGHTAIERLFEKPWDPDEMHWIGLTIQDVFKAHLSPHAAHALTLFYERGFCTICRHGAIELLAALGPLPPWMSEECRFDAYNETRRLARQSTDGGLEG